MFSRKKEADTVPDDKITATLSETIGVIEIFKSGRHKPMSGNSIVFPASMLGEVAANFDAKETPVPVVIGHPKTNDPAYAWAETVFVEDGILKATLGKVDPGFGQLVKEGKYKRISCAFYNPDSDNNPTPGQWSLRHIGFLGAAAPAVKGLKSVEFGEAGNGIVAFGMDDISGLPPEYELRLRQMENAAEVGKLIDEGKVLPCFTDDLLCFMDSLDDGEMVAFADGKEKAPLDWFRAYLNKQPTVVMFGRQDMGEAPEEIPPSRFAGPEGYEVDKDGLNLHAKATKIMKEQNVRFVDAVDIAQDG